MIKKLCMKTWYSSKIFMNLSIFLVWFFCPKLSQYLQSIYYYCDHQNWQAGYIQWVTFFQKLTRSLDHVVSWYYKKSEILYISNTTGNMTIKFGKVVSYYKGLLCIKSHHPLNTWSLEVTLQTKYVKSLLLQDLLLLNATRKYGS